MLSRPSRIALTCVVAHVAGAPAVLAAQAAQAAQAPPASQTTQVAQEPPSLPISLAKALLGYSDFVSRREPIFFVGGLPTGWPAALLPGAPITAVGGTKIGRYIVAVFLHPGSPAEASAAVRSMLDRAGFKHPVSRSASGGGFLSSGPTEPQNVYCRDSTQASFAHAGRAPAGSYLKLSIFPEGRSGYCRQQEALPETWRPALQVPALTPPEGVQVNGSGTGGGSDQIQTSAMIRDSLLAAPGVLVAHYAAQLKAAGWQVASPVSSDRIAANALDAKDKDGMDWTGILSFVRSPNGGELALRMRKVDRRR